VFKSLKITLAKLEGHPWTVAQGMTFATTKKKPQAKKKGAAAIPKDKLAAQHEKEKDGKKKERERLAAENQRKRDQLAKQREKVQKEKEKVREKAQSQKEKERQTREKEKQKAVVVREKQQNKEKMLKEKAKEKAAKEHAIVLKKQAREAENSKPVRARGPYTYFIKDTMKLLMAESPSSKVTELSKKAAVTWRSLTAENKQKYIDLASKDKERAKKDREAYEKTRPPKRPLSAYFLFLQKFRPKLVAENPSLKQNISEISKRAGTQWKAMSDAEKQPYQQQYQKNLAAFKIQNP